MGPVQALHNFQDVGPEDCSQAGQAGKGSWWVAWTLVDTEDILLTLAVVRIQEDTGCLKKREITLTTADQVQASKKKDEQ